MTSLFAMRYYPKSCHYAIGLFCLLVGVGTWIACGPIPPFTYYDPPPTFAVYYTLSAQPLLYYPPAYDGGSQLDGVWKYDIYNPTFETLGNAKEFYSWINFKEYHIVQDGRWPADWLVYSLSGCGKGSYDEGDIVQKIWELECVVQSGSMSVNPPSLGITLPATLRLHFDTGKVPGGTQAQIYFADTVGILYDEQDVSVDSSGYATVECPDLPKGTHYIVADFVNLPGDNYGASVTINRYCPYQCP